MFMFLVLVLFASELDFCNTKDETPKPLARDKPWNMTKNPFTMN
jgi:hypothetical protein